MGDSTGGALAARAQAATLLIEEWLPIQELGIEAQRERGASSALPPLYFLHVWWARRPLVVSRAAVLASLLPAWRPDWPAPLLQRFPTREAYHAWFRWLLGIRGDAVQARQLSLNARARGERLQFNPFDYPRAFTCSPTEDELSVLGELLGVHGTGCITVLDPTAGGGSIPLEALRCGFTVYANELNPVASVILQTTLDYPARYGEEFSTTIREWGDRLYALVEERLADFYAPGDAHDYLWARTVACPQTGKPIPLSPNWWLQRDDRAHVAVRLRCQPEWPACQFEIVRGREADRVAG